MLAENKSKKSFGWLALRSGRSRQLQAEGLLLLTTLIWGSTFLVVQNSIKLMGPYSFIALRFAIGALALGIIFHRRLLRLTRAELGSGVLIGVFLFAGYALQTLGLQYTTSSKIGFITGLNVVIVPVLSIFVLQQWPSLGATLGVIMAAIGMALLSVGNNFDLQFGLGEGLGLGCAFCFAWQIVLISRLAPGKDAFNLAIIQVATTALLGAVFAPIVGEPVEMPPGEIWVAVLFMGLIGTAFTFAVMNRVQQFTSSTRAALIYALEPVFAGLFGYLAGEALTIPAWIGCALIFGGMICGELKFKRDAIEQAPESEELAVV